MVLLEAVHRALSMLPSSAQQPPLQESQDLPHFPAAKLRLGHTPSWTWSRDLNPCPSDPSVYALSKLMKALTIFTLWPAVDEMFQVHSFRLGYLSGQLGLIRVPSALLILYAQPAGGQRGHTEGSFSSAQASITGESQGQYPMYGQPSWIWCDLVLTLFEGRRGIFVTTAIH